MGWGDEKSDGRRVKSEERTAKSGKIHYLSTISIPFVVIQSDLLFNIPLLAKLNNCHDVNVFEKLRFENVFRPFWNVKPVFSNSCGLKSGFEKLVTD